MVNPIKGVPSVIGRLLLALIFLMDPLFEKIPNFHKVTEEMAAQGIPLPKIALVGGIIFMIAGSISIILGYWPRVGATMLFIFLFLTMIFFHDFWTMEGKEKQEQMIHFMKNLSMAGAMIFIIGNGSGAMSLDHHRRK